MLIGLLIFLIVDLSSALHLVGCFFPPQCYRRNIGLSTDHFILNLRGGESEGHQGQKRGYSFVDKKSTEDALLEDDR
jgi:hypothetical protein